MWRLITPSRAPVFIHAGRSLHFTPTYLRETIATANDDLFGAKVSDVNASDASSAESPSARTSKLRSRKLTTEERQARFDRLFNFVSEKLGSRPAVKIPQLRNSAWINLFGLAMTGEQLEKVAELFPRWRDSRREFNARHAEVFVRRCEELSTPKLALRIFGDHSKYGVSLSLPAARHLLHSLHVDHPLQDTITAAALFRAHNLPPVSEDLVSCSMLASACLRHGTKHSLRVSRVLVPHLRHMLCDTEPLPISSVPTERALDKPRVWLKWTLGKIEKALRNQTRAGDLEWLSTWRKRSGHITESYSQ